MNHFFNTKQLADCILAPLLLFIAVHFYYRKKLGKLLDVAV